MVKYIRDNRSGRFAGSIGTGKTRTPESNAIKSVETFNSSEQIDEKLRQLVEKFVTQNGHAPTLGLDLDGTSADMVGGLRPYMGKVRKIPADQWNELFPQPDEYAMWLGDNAWFEDKTDFLNHFQASEKTGMYKTLPAYELAPETCVRLKKLGFNIKAITARDSMFNTDTRQWIREKNFPVEEIIHNGYNKSEVENIDLYLDDAPHVIEQLIANDKPVIVKTQDYNRKVENHPNMRRATEWGNPMVQAISELLEKQLNR